MSAFRFAAGAVLAIASWSGAALATGSPISGPDLRSATPPQFVAVPPSEVAQRCGQHAEDPFAKLPRITAALKRLDPPFLDAVTDPNGQPADRGKDAGGRSVPVFHEMNGLDPGQEMPAGCWAYKFGRSKTGGVDVAWAPEFIAANKGVGPDCRGLEGQYTPSTP